MSDQGGIVIGSFKNGSQITYCVVDLTKEYSLFHYLSENNKSSLLLLFQRRGKVFDSFEEACSAARSLAVGTLLYNSGVYFKEYDHHLFDDQKSYEKTRDDLFKSQSRIVAMENSMAADIASLERRKEELQKVKIEKDNLEQFISIFERIIK